MTVSLNSLTSFTSSTSSRARQLGSRMGLWLQVAVAVVAAGLLAAMVAALVASDGAADSPGTPASVQGVHSHPHPGHPYAGGADSWRLCFDTARSYHAWADAQTGMPRCEVPGF